MSTFWGVQVKANDHKLAEIPDSFALVIRSMSLVKGKKAVVSATIDDVKYVFCTLIESVFPQHSFNLALYPGCVIDLKIESEDKDAVVNFVGAFESLDSGMDFDDEDDDDEELDDELDDEENEEDEEEEEEEEEEKKKQQPVKAEKRKKEEKKPAAAAATSEIKCEVCNRIFKTQQSMEQHMNSKHKK